MSSDKTSLNEQEQAIVKLVKRYPDSTTGVLSHLSKLKESVFAASFTSLLKRGWIAKKAGDRYFVTTKTIQFLLEQELKQKEIEMNPQQEEQKVTLENENKSAVLDKEEQQHIECLYEHLLDIQSNAVEGKLLFVSFAKLMNDLEYDYNLKFTHAQTDELLQKCKKQKDPNERLLKLVQDPRASFQLMRYQVLPLPPAVHAKPIQNKPPIEQNLGAVKKQEEKVAPIKQVAPISTETYIKANVPLHLNEAVYLCKAAILRHGGVNLPSSAIQDWGAEKMPFRKQIIRAAVLEIHHEVKQRDEMNEEEEYENMPDLIE
jgi:hypothetical protein